MLYKNTVLWVLCALCEAVSAWEKEDFFVLGDQRFQQVGNSNRIISKIAISTDALKYYTNE